MNLGDLPLRHQNIVFVVLDCAQCLLHRKFSSTGFRYVWQKGITYAAHIGFIISCVFCCISTALLQYTQHMWKQRCALVTATRNGTMEQYHRSNAFNLFRDLVQNPEQLEYRHRSLLRRKHDFFINGNFLAVQMWFKKATTSIHYRSTKNRSVGRDIRNWIVRRPYDPGRRIRGDRIPNCRRLRRLRRS